LFVVERSALAKKRKRKPMRRQEIRDEEEYKRKLNAQIGFYKLTCVLNGAYNGYCSGPITAFSRQGHGLCKRHQDVVREKGRVSMGGGSFFLKQVGESA
jgi:hypothetical protein